MNAGVAVVPKQIPQLNSQSYLNYEYILLRTNCRIKCSQCIVSIMFCNVIVTIANIPAAVVEVAVLLPSVLLSQ